MFLKTFANYPWYYNGLIDSPFSAAASKVSTNFIFEALLG